MSFTPEKASLSLAMGESKGRRMLCVSGEIDVATTPALESMLASLLRDPETIVLDLSETTFIDSSGLHVLLYTSSKGSPRLVIRKPHPSVVRALEVAGLLGKFEIER